MTQTTPTKEQIAEVVDKCHRLADPNQDGGDSVGHLWNALDEAADLIEALAAQLAEAQVALEKEEKAHERTINERDDAEDAMSDAYLFATGEAVQWSNLFGFEQVLDAIYAEIFRLRQAEATAASARETALEEAASVAETEPNLPGEAPDEVHLLNAVDLARAVCHATIDNIALRIRALKSTPAPVSRVPSDAATICDDIAADPPPTPDGRDDDWQHGWQDGAMACAAEIRHRASAEPTEREGE